MVDTAEPHAYYQHNRQAERCSQIRGVVVVVKRYAESTHALNHDDIRLCSNLSVATQQVSEVDADPGGGGHDMRRGRFFKQIRGA